MLALLGALVAGAGLGCLLARAATGGAAGPGEAGYNRGYHHGWRDGYDQGYAAARGNPSTSPGHALTFHEARSASARASVEDAAGVARTWQPTGQYEAGVYDCNDMAEELWTAFNQAGVPSFMVVGNIRLDNEAFDDCDHCWVVVFCADESTGQEVTLAVDAQVGLVGAVDGPPGSAGALATAGAGILPGVSAQYTEGFFYPDPSGLRQDLGSRW